MNKYIFGSEKFGRLINGLGRDGFHTLATLTEKANNIIKANQS